MNDLIPHNRPMVTDEDRSAVDTVLRTGRIASGEEVEELERDFDTIYGGGASCAVSSGTAALLVALRSLQLGSDPVVAVPTYSCSALLNAIFFAGGTPLVVDVSRNDLNMDLESLEGAIARHGRSPDVVVAVHSFGAPADVQALSSVGAPVIEDCCQSLGGAIGAEPIGGFGAASVFSFYATKIVTGGHGGLVRDRDGVVAEAARDFRQFDLRTDYAPRFNVHMTDFQAAMVRSQLRRLDWIAERRRSIASRYLATLPTHVLVEAGIEEPGRMVYRFVVQLANQQRRDEVRSRLSEAGIQTIVPIERFELLHRYLGLEPAAFPVAEAMTDLTLSLPLYPGLSDAEVDHVVAALETVRW